MPPSPTVSLGMPPADFLRANGTEQVYRKGQFIFYEGHRPLGLYVHESGLIGFFCNGTRTGECREACILGADALSTEGLFTFSARAEGTVRLIFVGRSALGITQDGGSPMFQAPLHLVSRGVSAFDADDGWCYGRVTGP